MNKLNNNQFFEPTCEVDFVTGRINIYIKNCFDKEMVNISLSKAHLYCYKLLQNVIIYNNITVPL